MHNRSDQFAKNLLRDALSRASTADTEVEVVAATQRIDVYSVPDPARTAERAEMGLLGELSSEPCLFEPFHSTPSLRRVRQCLRKQLTWHHELERRARASAGQPDAAAEPQPLAPFPRLIIVGPGRPETVLDAFGCRRSQSGVYDAVPGVAMRVVVLAELPRTRATLLLRLLGSGRLLIDALTDLEKLPASVWERSIAGPLLIHFGLGGISASDAEDDVQAEIREWWRLHKENERKMQAEARKDGARAILLRLLRSRFGELPPEVVARVQAADDDDLERWGDRVLDAQSLADVVHIPGTG